MMDRIAVRALIVALCAAICGEALASLDAVDPGIELASFGNTTFRHVRVKGGRPISLRGSGNTLLQNVVFEDVAGMIGAEEPLAMKSVSGVVFKDFAVTSAPGEKASQAVNETDGWERVR